MLGDGQRYVRRNRSRSKPSATSAAPETVRASRRVRRADGGDPDGLLVRGRVRDLARRLGHPIHVRVDPMLHPEKSRIDLVQAFNQSPGQVVRVGDEHEVELLPGRLPNPTSAAAVVDNRVVEVENGANNAGNTARIRILDVDDEQDYVLAEVVTAGVSAAKKRRRRGRGNWNRLRPNRPSSYANWPKRQRIKRRRELPSASPRDRGRGGAGQSALGRTARRGAGGCNHHCARRNPPRRGRGG